jgi:5'-deoxynucleotidase YfbR-like HD superfamily hydrolase
MPLSAGEYCSKFVDPALAIIRARLLEDRPTNVVDYFLEFHKEIKLDIEAASFAAASDSSSNSAGQSQLRQSPPPPPFHLIHSATSPDTAVIRSQTCVTAGQYTAAGGLSSPLHPPCVHLPVSATKAARLDDSVGDQHEYLNHSSPVSVGPCPAIRHLNARSALTFLHTCSLLKGTKRTGWLLRGLTNVESVADHSWRMALMVLLLGQSAGIDAQRATCIALVHDLAEALVGDIAPGQGVDKATKQRLEADAMSTIVGHLSAENAELGQHVRALWLEYENAQTAEALFVKDMDKLEMILQAREYANTFTQCFVVTFDQV